VYFFIQINNASEPETDFKQFVMNELSHFQNKIKQQKQSGSLSICYLGACRVKRYLSVDTS
jgi:hypothetical protein